MEQKLIIISLSSAFCLLPSVICRPSSVFCHLSSVLCKTNPILSAVGGLQMNLSYCMKMAYEYKHNWTLGENKPNQTQSKPVLRAVEWANLEKTAFSSSFKRGVSWRVFTVTKSSIKLVLRYFFLDFSRQIGIIILNWGG